MLDHEEAAYFDYLESRGLMPAYDAWLEDQQPKQKEEKQVVNHIPNHIVF